MNELEKTTKEGAESPLQPPPVQTGFSPRTDLGRELLALSEKARAEGLAPCGHEEIMTEIGARRTGR